MKTIRFTLVFLFVSSIFYSQNTVSNLIIEKGQTKKLPAASYKYNKVHIKSGATLEFLEGSTIWAVINCEEFILEGNIIYNSFKSGIGNIKTTTDDGFLLEYTFPESSIGGSGGKGGDSSRFILRLGGEGFVSKNQNGGGGGGGAQQTKYSALNGDDARGYEGAKGILTAAYSSGGNGGKFNNNHGGLLSINTNIFNSNENSWIFLNGKLGKNGTDGTDGSIDDAFSGGGGGGGSAGGDGGVLIVRATKYLGKHPKTNIAGGFGGEGGKRGETFNPPLFYGLNGKDGENGKDGYVSWLQK